jgi:hypothetical protein
MLSASALSELGGMEKANGAHQQRAASLILGQRPSWPGRAPAQATTWNPGCPQQWQLRPTEGQFASPCQTEKCSPPVVFRLCRQKKSQQKEMLPGISSHQLRNTLYNISVHPKPLSKKILLPVKAERGYHPFSHTPKLQSKSHPKTNVRSQQNARVSQVVRQKKEKIKKRKFFTTTHTAPDSNPRRHLSPHPVPWRSHLHLHLHSHLVHGLTPQPSTPSPSVSPPLCPPLS